MQLQHIKFSRPAPPYNRKERYGRLHITKDGWLTRADMDWTVESQQVGTVKMAAEASHSQYMAEIEIAKPNRRRGEENIAIHMNVEGEPEEAIDLARRILGLPRRDTLDASALDASADTKAPEQSLPTEDDYSALRQVPKDMAICTATEAFLQRKRITDLSLSLGSYGHGGLGWAGWQIDHGSWLVLPLASSGDWMTLSVETLHIVDPQDGLMMVDIKQRIMSCHPDQLKTFTPWQHNFCGSEVIDELPDFATIQPKIIGFAASKTGFYLHAGRDKTIYKFAINEQLPRPCFAGSQAPRRFRPQDDLSRALVMAHSCHIEV